MKLRGFWNSNSLSSFALALWFSLLLIRIFESVSIVESGKIGAVFNAFISGFWNDLAFIVFVTLCLGLALFIIYLIKRSAIKHVSNVFGLLTIFGAAVFTFYYISKGSLLNYKELAEFGGSESSIIGLLRYAIQPANLILLFFAFGIFTLINNRSAGIKNNRFVPVLILGLFIIGIAPPLTSWFDLNPDYQPIAHNKNQFFLDKNYSNIPFFDSTNYFYSGEDQQVNTANFIADLDDFDLFSNTEEEAGNSAVAAKKLSDSKLLTEEDRAYITENNLESVSSGQLYKLARSLSYETKYSEAETVARYLLFRDGSSADYRLNYGLILAWQRKFDMARIECNKALELAPNYEDIYLALADINYWDNKKTEAIHILDSGIENVENPDRLYDKKASLLSK